MSNNTVTTPGLMIEITDPDRKKSEKTPGQVFSSYSGSDSKLVQSQCPLTYCQIRKYRRDPTANLAKWAIFSQMQHTPWVPKNFRDKASQEMLDYIEETLTPLRTNFLMQATFGSLDFGWQPFEVVFKPDNGYIFVDNFKPLLQDYTDILVYTDTGGFAGLYNETTGFHTVANGKYNGAVKVLGMYALNTNFVVEGTDWYGESVYENLYPIMDSWNSVEKVANRYDAKIAGASWVVYYPVGSTPFNGALKNNLEIAKAILNDLESNGCTAIPDEVQEWMDDSIDREAKGKWRIELMTAKGGGGSGGMIDRQKYLDVLKMRGFGFPERSILEGKHGTKEDAAEHGDIGLAIVDTKHRILTNHLNLYTLPKALEINFGKKMMWEAGVEPAPLVDSQFALLKDIYRVLLQNPDVSKKEVASIDMETMKQELGLPISTNVVDYTSFDDDSVPRIGSSVGAEV